MDKKLLVKTFNNHLCEFIDDVISVFPREVDLLTSRTFIKGVIKVKPKVIIQYWYQHIYLNYKTEIDNGDFEFFLKKDYNNDVTDNDVLSSIEKMRVKIAGLSNESREKAVTYAKNLSKISVLYYS
tara:strand:- start:1753 stop:2130 length:378 start_codon:yes stop_codon:yes gene_type:complete